MVKIPHVILYRVRESGHRRLQGRSQGRADLIRWPGIGSWIPVAAGVEPKPVCCIETKRVKELAYNTDKRAIPEKVSYELK